MAKTQYWQFIGGFVDGMIKQPAKGFTKSRAVALKRKVKGTRLKRVFYAKGKKGCQLFACKKKYK